MQTTTTFRSATLEVAAEKPVQVVTSRLARTPHLPAALLRMAIFLTLSVAILLVHGYHPLAEDGGLYIAGVELTLRPTLFPHFTDFVLEHLHFSIFAPVVAAITRATHLPLLAVLFLLNLLSIGLTIAAAHALLHRITRDSRAQLAGIATLAAAWTVPIAGTSLLLMDPYVTARSLSTPLSLWAITFALDDWKDNPRSLVGCVVAIALATSFHPLMAGYALGLIVVQRILRSRKPSLLLTTLASLTLAAAAILQLRAPAESAAVILAAKSRYYWFPSQWHWYELFGLFGPILVLFAIRHWNLSGLGERGTMLAAATIFYACFATAVALIFAHEHFQAHIIARLQPLRAFLPIYLVMFLLLGASMQQLFERASSQSSGRRYLRYAMIPILFASAIVMFAAERAQFPGSAHVEPPWRLHQSTNPWVRAFLWCRDNTPQNALFALDPYYITTPGEDAQTFRAIAQRSALPDFSKDGGEAAITPRLADQWVAGFTAQVNLESQTAAHLREHLAHFGVDWVILRSNSRAALNCPYHNELLKVCRLQR